MVIALLAPIGMVAWIEVSLHRTWVFTEYAGRPAPAQGTTWLLVGSDNRSDLPPERQADLATGGDVGGGRTDTIILVHTPGPGADTATTVVSIPRDSYVPIPGYGEDKINAAFALGGPQLLTQTVEQATGIRLDHYIEIGFSGFADIVDALGGITMCPAEPIDAPLAGIDLPAGCQKLNGPDALGYVRTRATPRADLDRMAHQRAFMSAVFHRAASPGVWLNPLNWLPLKNALTNAMTVDARVHVWDLAQLGWAMGGSPNTTTVPIAGFSTVSSGDIVTWDHDAASRLFEALRTDSPVPEDVLEPQR